MLMSILIMGVSSLFRQQSSNVRVLSEMMAVSDVGKSLVTAMADGSVCNYVATNSGGPLTFDSTQVSPTTPQLISVPTLYASVSSTGVPGPILAQATLAPSVYANTVVIKSIQLSIDGAPSPLPPPQTGVTFTGSWLVGFDPTQSAQPLKPAHASATLTVDTTTPTAAKVTGCKSATSSSASLVPGSCPAGQVVTGLANGTTVCSNQTGAACTITGSPYGSTTKGVVINGPGGRCCVIPNSATHIVSDGTVCYPF